MFFHLIYTKTLDSNPYVDGFLHINTILIDSYSGTIEYDGGTMSFVEIIKKTSLPIWMLVVLALGGGAGTAISWFLRGQQEADRLEVRKRMTDQILNKMKTLEVGNTLRDHMFEDLEENKVPLSSMIHGNTMISIISPSCPSCIDELNQLKHTVHDSSDFKYFVFISSGNPRFLRDVRDSTNVPSLFLYDHRAEYLSIYNITTYPFNITVDSNLVVRNITSGAFLDDEIIDLIETNRN